MEKLLLDIIDTFEQFINDADRQITRGSNLAGRHARTGSTKLANMLKEFRRKSLEMQALSKKNGSDR